MKKSTHSPIDPPALVTRTEWFAARRQLLEQEKAFTRERDRLNQRRRALPWVRVDQPYTFESPRGRVSLGDLFAGRHQLIVYHFMLADGWEEGCRGCSYVADHFDGTLAHLHARDVSFTAVSLAPLAEIERFKTRMGWGFDWVSSHGTSFNYDYHVSFTPAEVEAGQADYNFGRREIMSDEMPGLSVFARDAAGAIHHTYSTYSRGLDLLIGAYNLLDLVPKGRDEDQAAPMKWVRHHDRYDLITSVG